eukprot:4894720-Alexandrium_andersonii.AAC.1
MLDDPAPRAAPAHAPRTVGSNLDRPAPQGCPLRAWRWLGRVRAATRTAEGRGSAWVSSQSALAT